MPVRAWWLISMVPNPIQSNLAKQSGRYSWLQTTTGLQPEAHACCKQTRTLLTSAALKF